MRLGRHARRQEDALLNLWRRPFHTREHSRTARRAGGDGRLGGGTMLRTCDRAHVGERGRAGEGEGEVGDVGEQDERHAICGN